MSNQPDLLELDEVARWEHDLQHGTWALGAPPEGANTLTAGGAQ